LITIFISITVFTCNSNLSYLSLFAYIKNIKKFRDIILLKIKPDYLKCIIWEF